MTVAEYNLCVEKYADGIFRFILKNLGDSYKAQDIVQDTFAKLWVRYSEVSYSKSKSYLYTTAYHTMIDSIRKEKFSENLEDFSTLPINHNSQYSDLKEILDEAIKNLPKKQKSALLLRDYEGYSYKEIEEITGLKESQVKVYIYRARKYLMNYIGSIEKVI